MIKSIPSAFFYWMSCGLVGWATVNAIAGDYIKSLTFSATAVATIFIAAYLRSDL